MRPVDAERLLGGHATGTLTPAERQRLYEAALAHQAVFDALMDEEALRELLADPEAKAQLLAALARPAPRVRPLWRHPGVLGAAATLLVGVTAGLAYRRSALQAPPALQRELGVPRAAPAPPSPPAPAQPQPVPERRPEPGPALRRAPVAAPAPLQDRAVPGPQAGSVPAAVPPPPAPPVEALETASRHRAEALRGQLELKRQDTAQKAKAAPAAGRVGALSLLGPPAPAPAMAGAVAEARPAEALPSWRLAPGPGGTTRVELACRTGATVVLLLRRPPGARVVPLAPLPRLGGRDRWGAELRLEAGDALDFYVLDAPTDAPAALPERGPVAGTRIRIHPPAENSSTP